VVIALLAGCLIWFGFHIVRLERYHYANMVGMCREKPDLVQRDICLSRAESRTHWMYHLAYGLRLL
jgi:hypothetical protein